MNFKRTNKGISNYSFFHNVDLSIFTEGGDGITYSKSDIYLGKGSDKSFDILFWKKLFSLFRPNIKIYFKSVGSCETLKEIAKDIISEKITGACVVLDKDISDLFKSKLQHPNVIYTKNYSWESDFFNEIIIQKTLFSINPFLNQNKDIIFHIKDQLVKFEKKLKYPTIADVLLLFAKKRLFERNINSGDIIFESNHLAPVINSKFIKGKIRNSRREIGKFSLIKKIKIETLKHCCGKTLMAVAIKIVQSILKNYQKNTLPNEYCLGIMITCFENLEKYKIPHRNYYENVIKKVNV